MAKASTNQTSALNIENSLTGLIESYRRVNVFGDLITQADDVDPRCKMLWIDIYRNAVADRELASSQFDMLYAKLSPDISVENYNAIAPTAIKYLERMHKSNDQLLELAKVVSEAVHFKPTQGPLDIFDEISTEK